MLQEFIQWYRTGETPVKELPRLLSRRLQANIKPYAYQLKSIFPSLQVSSSQSDRIDYNRICRRAVLSEKVFAHFKRHPDYKVVLEHVSEKFGKKYLDIILQREPDISKYFDRFRTNDTLGDPYVFHYKGAGVFSPTTLRYMKVLQDLLKIFGSMDGYDIVEIGGGYGGQCKIISDAVKYRSYTAIDLPDVLRLMHKYLKRLSVPSVYFLEQNIVGKRSYDLLVSNYAFSECAKPVQEHYMTHVLQHAKRAYITYNGGRIGSTLDRPWTPYNKEEILGRLQEIHNLQIIPEQPQTGTHENFIIIWDDGK